MSKSMINSLFHPVQNKAIVENGLIRGWRINPRIGLDRIAKFHYFPDTDWTGFWFAGLDWAGFWKVYPFLALVPRLRSSRSGNPPVGQDQPIWQVKAKKACTNSPKIQGTMFFWGENKSGLADVLWSLKIAAKILWRAELLSKCMRFDTPILSPKNPAKRKVFSPLLV